MFALANRVSTQGRRPVSVPVMDDRGDYPVRLFNSKAKLDAELRSSQQMVLELRLQRQFSQNWAALPVILPRSGLNAVYRLQRPGAGTSNDRPPG